MTKIAELIGAPFDLGASRRGCSMGSCALRIAGLADRLTSLGWKVIDQGDLRATPITSKNPAGLANYWREVGGWANALHNAVFASLSNGHVPISLGGDHAISMGSVTAASRHANACGKPLFVLWLDAHADFNTPLTSPSGNMHGMPVAFFTGLDGFDGLMNDPLPVVPFENVYLLGVRSIDRDERKSASDAGIHIYDMRAVDEFGISALMRTLLKRVEAAGGMLHVSLDADFIDPEVAPGVGTPVKGGATWREAQLVMEMLADSGLMTSMDIVELNPFLDEKGKTAHTLVDLTASLFGERIQEAVDAQRFLGTSDGQKNARMLQSV